MKTSFYFFLWFIVYYLIGLTGSQLLIQNDFFVALILVFFISRLDHRIFYKETQYQAALNRINTFEIFYQNDAKKMGKIVREQLIGQTIWAIYCMLTIAGLFAIHNDDLVAYGVFGFFGIMSMIASNKYFCQYRDIKKNGLPSFDKSQYAGEGDAYQRYCELRNRYSLQELLPQKPSISKWVNIASLVFALACMLGGLYYLIIILFKVSHINMLFSAMLIWAVLAVFFGIKDFVSSLRSLQNKSLPKLN